MIRYWKSLEYTTKFSVLAFIVVGFLSLFSMGALGAGLYYPVSFLFNSYPTLNNWRGDWIWPAMIGAGMMWSFGFLLGGLAWHYTSRLTSSLLLLRLAYVLVLWAWAAAIWWVLITVNVEAL